MDTGGKGRKTARGAGRTEGAGVGAQPADTGARPLGAEPHDEEGRRRADDRRGREAGREARADGGRARGAYHREDLRRELLDRGLSLLARDGLAAFSLRALAQDLGVSHAAPYRHFASREELLTAIVREGMDRFETALLASPIVEGEPEENLFRLGEAYVRFYLANPEILVLFNLLPGALGEGPGGLAAIFQATRGADSPPCDLDPANDAGFQALSRAASAFFSKYPGLSERDVILGFWAKAHGLACLLAVKPDWFSPEDRDAGLARVIRSAF